jgi:hypothetical protein
MSSKLLLNNPEEYARRAIDVLEWQVSTAKSTNKKARLNSKIQQWKKTLELLSDSNGNKEEVTAPQE